MSDSTKQSVLFEHVIGKPVHATFETDASTSGAGRAVLAAADARLGLTRALVAHLTDVRDPGQVIHGLDESLRQ